MRDWNEEAIVFECCGEPLVGIVHRVARSESRLGVLIVVGGPQYRVGSHRQFTLMARALAASGFPVLRFDYRGMGDSEGEVRSFEDVYDDLKVALDVFTRKGGTQLDGVVVFGLCDAASVTLMHGTRDPRVKGLVLANPWVRSPAGEARSYVRHYYSRRLLQRTFWRKLFSGELRVGRSVADLVKAIARSRSGDASPKCFVQQMLEGLRAFPGPVLLLSSGRDLTAREFDDLCDRDPSWRSAIGRAGVEVVRLTDADHTFSARRDLELGKRLVVNWLRSTQAVACRPSRH